MKNKTRIGFLILWGVLMLSAQLPLLILYTAIGFNNLVVGITQVGAAIVCAMISAIMIVQEDY
jgi:hypothetical protein